MASNPQWCLTLGEWRRAFSRWIRTPEPEAILNAAIFFDLRPTYGRTVLAQRLWEWLHPAVADSPLFITLLAQNALAFRLRNQFRGDAVPGRRAGGREPGRPEAPRPDRPQGGVPAGAQLQERLALDHFYPEGDASSAGARGAPGEAARRRVGRPAASARARAAGEPADPSSPTGAPRNPGRPAGPTL